MTLPAWVRTGAKVVCIDDNWICIREAEMAPGRSPEKGEVCTIAAGHSVWETGYLILSDAHISPDYFEVCSFRPATPEEINAAMFAKWLKDAAASVVRVLEPAA